MKIKFKKEGNTILLSIFMLTMIFFVSLSAAYTAIKGLGIGRVQVESTKAYYAGEAGLEKVLWISRKDDFDYALCPQNSECSIDLETSACSANCDLNIEYFLENGASYLVKYFDNTEFGFSSIGNFSDTKRKVEAVYE